jgi:tetratricopeptide (TPR) repeat protein
VFLSGFALLVSFLAPGLYLRDSGELTAAAFTLGVAHETGFPLYCLLGKLAALMPLGEVAFRLSLLSAVSGAAAAWAVYRTVRELVGDGVLAEVAGAGGAASTLAGLTFWKASTVAEVYAPTAAALAVGLWLLLRVERGSSRAGIGLALLGGLSLGLHAQLRLLLGPPVFVFALLRLRRGARWPLFGPLAVAVGAAVVAYLPLRAAAGPIANWSNPRTLGGVVRHLAASRIRAAFADQILTGDFRLLGERLGAFGAQVEGQIGAVVLLVAAGGLWWLLFRRSRVMGVVLALLLFGDALYSSWINPMGMDDLQDGAPTAVALALLLGVGLAAAAQRFPRRGQPLVAGALAVMALVVPALSDADAKLKLGFDADAYSRSALMQAPPRAALYAESDDLIAGAFYLQVADGLRPDVTLLARQQVARLGARLERDLAERAVVWEPGSDEAPSSALLVRADTVTADDPFARRLVAENLNGLGRAALQHGQEREAESLFSSALTAHPGDAVASTNLAVLRARQGDFAAALRLCEEVLRRDPARQTARLNAARYRLQLSDLDGADGDFREYARRAPREAAPWVGRSRVAARRGDRPGAEAYLREALERDPHSAEALAWKRELR